MTDVIIEYEGRLPTGAKSACGRAVAWTNHHGEVNGGALLDGRPVWRGYYTLDGRQTSEEVAADDWRLVCDLYTALRAARERVHIELEREAYARAVARERALDGIERVRGGAYDPYVDGPNKSF